MFHYDFYQQNIRILGVIAILVSLGAWAMDWLDVVYACPFCQVQRTVIGLLGVLMLLASSHFIVKYVASVIGFFGTGVAMMQHFRGWVVGAHRVLPTREIVAHLAHNAKPIFPGSDSTPKTAARKVRSKGGSKNK